ncbi:NrtR DNA-binding winged helix domain-containing protein [Actinomadura verrucosospora]|uniref:NrtR DNA-binding winged helix domain-containing protein n=1 Tax=Actinomadura verrucosospora TaxID=46165 RepID=UPI0015670330|nr:hypothetical protein [Actinomadura verrucosospora]
MAAAFCGELFTISNLCEVYMVVWGVQINPQNFQRKVFSAKGFVVKTRHKRTCRPGTPAELFRRGQAQILYPPWCGPGGEGAP